MNKSLLISALALALTALAPAAQACQAEVKAKLGNAYIHQWMTVAAEQCTPEAVVAALQGQGYRNVVVVNLRQ
jgi:hypothetical protein